MKTLRKLTLASAAIAAIQTAHASNAHERWMLDIEKKGDTAVWSYTWSGDYETILGDADNTVDWVVKYDDDKRVISIDGPELGIVDQTRMNWAADGRSVSVDFPTHTGIYFFDEHGRLIEKIDSQGQKLKVVYKDLNNEPSRFVQFESVSFSDTVTGDNKSWDFFYDENDWPVGVTEKNSAEETTHYLLTERSLYKKAWAEAYAISLDHYSDISEARIIIPPEPKRTGGFTLDPSLFGNATSDYSASDPYEIELIYEDFTSDRASLREGGSGGGGGWATDEVVVTGTIIRRGFTNLYFSWDEYFVDRRVAQFQTAYDGFFEIGDICSFFTGFEDFARGMSRRVTSTLILPAMNAAGFFNPDSQQQIDTAEELSGAIVDFALRHPGITADAAANQFETDPVRFAGRIAGSAALGTSFGQFTRLVTGGSGLAGVGLGLGMSGAVSFSSIRGDIDNLSLGLVGGSATVTAPPESLAVFTSFFLVNGYDVTITDNGTATSTVTVSGNGLESPLMLNVVNADMVGCR